MAETVSGGVTVRDVAAPKFIVAYAEVLKNNDKFVVPKWVDIVKIGTTSVLVSHQQTRLWHVARVWFSLWCSAL
jgi:ribosomal protein S19E (S16A)